MDLNAPKLTQRIEINVWSTDHQPEANDQSHSNENRDNCWSCGKPALKFEDENNRIEFQKFGECQECQDKVVRLFKQP